ncbi:hypothetical protein FRC02_012073 [Tulasnella sp. 418]|nr:hypothetical protein FRC02_012073 [Tulasnella sp. 418]
MKGSTILTNDVHHLNVADKLKITVKDIARGGYSNVSKGTLVDEKGNTIEVAIKTFRNRGPTNSSEAEDFSTLHRKLLKEVNIWHRLNHPNVARLLGVAIPTHEAPSLISPWFENGNVTKYLESHPEANRIQILYDLSCGLAYLHSLDIVHGDIKPVSVSNTELWVCADSELKENALVDGEGRAYWCDFGLSHFLEGAPGCTGQTSSSTFRGGTAPFLSPEQVEFDGERQRKTTKMDIWAFGCLMAQVMSAQQLYKGCRADYQVHREILYGNLPMKTSIQVTLNPRLKPLWTIVDKCWRKDPRARPTAYEVLGWLSKLVDPLAILIHEEMRYDVGFNSGLVEQNYYNDNYPNTYVTWKPFFFEPSCHHGKYLMENQLR